MTDVTQIGAQEFLMQAIAPEVGKIEQIMQEDLQEATAGTDPLLREALEYGILNGGKRLRPLLVVLSAFLCGFKGEQEDKETLYKLAIAFEYLHGATLFHDDVIDHSEMRRGKPSVNEKFGTIAAILGGDFLHSRSMLIVGSLGGKKALQVFCQATNAMVDGEFLQLRNTQNYNFSEDDYFAAVKGKTALLIAATCKVGAMAGGGDCARQQVLEQYGISLGTAFQIVDDLLDYQGDPSQTGKAIGNDFQEGKMTLPVILALDAAGGEDKARLLFLLENENARRTGFAEAYEIIERYDGFGRSRNSAESIVAKAISGLEIFSDKEISPILTIFKALAQYVLTRKK